MRRVLPGIATEVHDPMQPRRSCCAGGRGMRVARTCHGCSVIGLTTSLRSPRSWKEQTLLNVVRLRYGDAPSFADVSSVISGYTFQGGLSAGAGISSNLTSTIPSNLVTVNGNATYIDRPTITYTPLAGDKFARSLLRPLPPNEVFELVQAGYPARYRVVADNLRDQRHLQPVSIGASGPPGRPRILPAAGCVAPFAAFRRGQRPAGQAWGGGGGHAHPDCRPACAIG